MIARYKLEKFLLKFSDIFWTVLAQSFVILSSFLTFKIISSNLGPYEFGQFSIQVSYSSILSILLFNPALNSISRFFSQIYIAKQQTEIRLFILQVTLIGIFSAGVIFGIQNYINQFFDNFIRIGSLSLLLSVVTFLSFIPLSILTSIGKVKWVATLQAVDFLVKCGVFLIISKELANANQAIGLLVISCFATFIFGIFIYRKCVVIDHVQASTIKSVLSRDLFRYMLPFVISGLITWAATYLDRFIIQSKLGSQDLGLYAATLQIASFPSNFFSSIMSQLFVPRIYLSETGGLSNVEIVTSFRRQVFRASIFICPFLVIFIFLGEEIVTILSSSEYFIDRLSFAITVFGSLFLQIGNVLGAEGMLYKNVGAYLFPKIVHVAVVYFALNFLTGHFKVYGAFLSVLFSGFSFFILIVITNQNLTYRIKN